jgi:hypothetical protein
MAGAYFVGILTDWLHRYRTCLFVFLSLAAVLFTLWSVIIAEKLEVCEYPNAPPFSSALNTT